MKIKIPMAAQIMLLFLGLIVVSTMMVSQQSYDKFEEVLVQREEYSNLTESSLRAKEVEQSLQNLMQKTFLISKEILLQKNPLLEDKNVFGIELWVKEEDHYVKKHSLYNNKWIEDNKLSLDYLEQINQENYNKNLIKEKVSIINNSKKDLTTVGTLVFPLVKQEDEISYIAVVNFDLLKLQKMVELNQEKNTYITNSKGQILAHPNEKYLWEPQGIVLVQKAIAAENSQQIQFTDENKKEQIGAFTKVNNYDFIVYSETSRDQLMEPALDVKYKIFRTAGEIFSAAILIIFLFASFLTKPVKLLSSLMNKVSAGDLTVKAQDQLKGIFKSETHDLAENFDKMTEGLKEREKVKNILNKFHGQTITQDLLEKDLHVRGDKKNVVVFFSDIRGFTSYSEKHSPEDVVKMLNEYFECMVSVIAKRGGVVDKFIGDAIMAVWGVPKESPEDAKNAVFACLEMRQKLSELNEKRIQRGEEPINIGMGLHLGSAISGIIGSQEKMEYTVIGDTVNMTSRLEASTKSFGSDLLISEAVITSVGDKFLTQEAGKVSVKGKEQPIALYKVTGYINDLGEPVEVVTPYSSYEATGDEKVKKTA